MLRRACAVAASALGLAFAPAVASAQDAPQQITDSAGAAQVGTTEVAPSAAADAPVTANAPITVALPESGGDAANSGGTSASASGGDDPSSEGSGGSPSDQDVTGSAGAAQVGSATVSSTVAADAPVTANAPITVLSPDSGGDASQTGGSEATPSGDSGTGSGDQEVTESSGSAQVGSVGVAPDAAAATPVTANAPVTVLSPSSGGDASQAEGSSATAESSGGSGSGEQDVSDSFGAAQVGSVEPHGGAAMAAPVTANAPVTVLSPGSRGDATGPGGTAIASAGGGGDTPTGPDSSAPSQASPGNDATTGDGGPDESTAGAGRDGAVPGGSDDGTVPGDPSRGTQGEFQPNPGTQTATERRSELGAPATGALPFTGLLVWLLGLAGALAMTIGTRGRQLTAA